MRRSREVWARELREELELKSVPAVVDQRLQAVYASLPEELPARKHRAMPPWARRGLYMAASLAGAFCLLLGINAANPALAEGIPFIGGIFESIRSNNSAWGATPDRLAAQGRLGQLAQAVSPEEGEPVAVPANGMGEKPFTIQLKEVYYDGSFVFAGLEVELDRDYGKLSENRQTVGYDMRINGESQVTHDPDTGKVGLEENLGNGFCDMSSFYWEQVERGRYVLQRAFRVPDSLRDSETLEVSLGFGGMYSSEQGELLNSTSFSLNFTAQKQEVEVQSVDCQGLEMGDVQLIAAYTTPAALCFIAEFPEDCTSPIAGAQFADGLRMGGLGGTYYSVGNGRMRSVGIYAGLSPEEDREIIWTFQDKNISGYGTVFGLDFQSGTARIGSAEDVKPAVEGDYACGVEAIRELKEGWIVEKYHADQEKPLLYLATAGFWKQDLQVEIWQDGQLVDRQDTRGDSSGWHNRTYWEYGVNHEEPVDGTEHNGWLLLMDRGYFGLDLRKPLTVRAYAGRDLVLEEEIQLTLHEGDRACIADPGIITIN